MTACPHPAEQERRSIYYLLCGACNSVRIVTYCNYAQECHPQCSLAGVCVQPARNRYHAHIPLRVEPSLLEAARARLQARAAGQENKG
jgi:hypothetical protein